MSNVAACYPLSPLQRGILFHSRLGDQPGAYVVQFACELHGRLDPDALRRAWQAVLDHHPVLRTAFVGDGDETLQVVGERVRLPWTEEDRRRLSSAEQDARDRADAAADLERGFDLSRAPLMRCSLVRLGEHRHRFRWTHHHLLLDGWSVARVIEQAFSLYGSLRRGEPARLEPVRPFADYVAWLEERDPGASESFWREQLRGFESATDPGLERVGRSPGFRYREARRTLSAPAARRLGEWARRRRLTLSTLIQGAWAILLGRHAGTRDVVFGVVVSGRPVDLDGADRMIGLFINTLPLRVRIDGRRPLGAWLEELQERVLEITEHQHTPLIEVQRWSDVPGGRPLFHSILLFENYPTGRRLAAASGTPAAGAGDDGSDRIAVRRPEILDHPHYPLNLFVVPGDELSFRLGHDAARFDAGAAARLLDHLVTLLEGFVATDAGQPVGRLPAVSRRERHYLITELNDSGWASGGGAESVDARLERVISGLPDAVALRCGSHSLTYGALGRRAAASARRLRRLGVTVEDRVGVIGERNPGLIPALLATWRTGAAYVPIDPAWPDERTGAVLADAGVRVVLAAGGAGERWRRRGYVVVDPEAADDSAPAGGDPGPPPDYGADRLAYVIYTSGSTGRPKGVEVTHRSVAAFLDAMRRRPGLSRRDRLLAVTTAAFDISVLELLLPLWCGAAVVIADAEAAADARVLRRLIARERIDVLQATPASWRLLVEDGWPGDPGLAALCGGEALPRELAHDLAARCRSLWNLYGPTETTVWSSVERVAPEARRVSVGRPIDGTAVVVLDRDLEPAPRGAVGEVWIGGAGVARGYRGRPALTAERFLPRPAGGGPGERLYGTGDLGRVLPDGRLEILGRRDHQVKVRGHRVELEEVEAALHRCPGVGRAAVVARPDVSGELALVGCVVPPPGGGPPSPEELRSELGRRLPDYMVPTRWLALEALPSTTSGKIDRRRLADLAATGAAERGGTGAAPQSEAERAVAAIWEEVLEIGAVGRDESFFDLGGHSLLAGRVLARIRDRLGVEVPLRALFDDPTVAGLAALVGETRQAATAPSPDGAREPNGTGGVAAYYPLSPLQQGILFHSRLGDRAGAYVVQFTCELHGRLDAAALRRAWQAVVDYHEVLRTAFVGDGDESLQVVGERARLPWSEEDWRPLGADEQRERARADLESDLERGFELSRAPLMRCALFRLGERRYRFRWTHHHLLLDGWSVSRVIREALSLYGAERRDQPLRLEPVRPFRDYIAWLQRQDPRASEEFWRGALSGFETPTSPGLGRASRPTEGVGYREARRPLDASATAGLRSRARRLRVTPNTLMQGAWAVLLGRYSGVRDVLFGVVVAGRPPELDGSETMVGLFINTLPLRVEVDERLGVGPWLARLQEQALALRDHEHTALIEASRWSDVPPGQPLFETTLVFENYPSVERLGGPPEAGGEMTPAVEGDRVEVRGPRILDHPHYLLNLVVTPGERIELRLGYDGARIEPAAAERLLDHLETLVRGFAAADRDLPLWRLPMLSAAERHHLLRERQPPAGRDGGRGFGGSVDERILEQCERRPDRVAVHGGGSFVTFGGLARGSAELARTLRRLGAGEQRIGVLAERRPETVIALLGVWRAGAAWVPIEPTWPEDRIVRVLADAGVRILLVPEGAAARPLLEGLTVLELSSPMLAPVAVERPAPAARKAPDRLAYVLYTSGSTGEPKGVMVGHGSLANYLGWCVERYPLAGGRGVPVHSSPAFDLTVTGLFGPLLVGGRVELMPAEDEVGALAAALRAEGGYSLLKVTPAHLDLLNHQLEPEALGGRTRGLILGGEALHGESLRPWREHAPETRLFNEYGPTEAVVGCCVHEVRDGDDLSMPVPIGRAIDGMQMYVLDRFLRPVPDGVAGELYIGGTGLARGYLGRPGQTALAWVPDPFADAGGRLYRSGDLGRWRSDGVLEYIGRRDRQVKLRGYRVEPGEIEATLLAHRGVEECAVLVAGEGAAAVLAAFVVGSAAGAPESAELEGFLERRLPRYLVPGVWIPLDRLPLTAGGKVDRRRLAASLPARIEARRTERVPPTTATERAVAEAWQEVLQIEAVGAHESFFDLGGHSLLAGRVLARIRDRLGVELPLGALFDAPTVAGLAAAVEQRRAASAVPERLRPRRPEEIYPLSFAQERLWFLYRMRPEVPAYNVPLALRLTGELDAGRLERALIEVVRRHAILRATFDTRDGEPAQTVHRDPRTRLPVVDLAACPGGRRDALAARLADREARRPFDLARGPVLRATLLALGRRRQLLLLTVHHIAFDGWSSGILVTELSSLYRALAEGLPAPLPELATQYPEHAREQREQLAGERLRTELDFWRRRLEGAPPLLELATDRPRPEFPSFRGGTLTFRIPAPAAAGLAALARARRASLFMVVAAAFAALLHRHSGQGDLVLGAPVANRGRVELEGLIGLFVNTLALRLRPGDGSIGFAALIDHVRAVVLEAYSHQELPFEKLVEELQPARSLAHAPLLQAVVSVQNAPRERLALPGLNLEPLPSTSRTAKVDLHLEVLETGDGLTGVLDYAADLFDATSVRRMAGHLATLIAGAVADPRRPLAELPLLSAAEGHALRLEWCRGEAPRRTTVSALAAFAAQVARSPERAAVVCAGRTLTYGGLDRRVRRLAALLRRRGVGPEVRVGLRLGPSPELVVAALGVLAAGGAFVPIDPAHPAERQRLMVEDAGLRLALVDDPGALGEIVETVVIDAGEPPAETAAEELPPPLPVEPERAAYVIYTSGSTGRPKGVVVPDRGLHNMALALGRRYGIGGASRLLQFASPSFDSAVAEIFGALLAGATLVVAPREAMLPGAGLASLLRERRVTHVTLPPSVLSSLPPSPLPALGTLISAGEACSAALVARWAGGRRFLNAYGPTEASVCATVSTCRAGEPAPAIGRPIEHVRVHVCDRRLAPPPAGVEGELYLGGEGVARGYLGRAALTAERFVPDPFGSAPGGRLYRTGDRVRWRAGGELEFLGRADRQVKLRGYRIEPAEIESALAALPGVAEAVVELREVGGEPALAAWIARGEMRPPHAGELRDALRAQLPAYMVPSRFTVVDELPRTASGKVDRRRLADPRGPQRGVGGAGAAPGTALEQRIAEVWREVLAIDRIGVEDDFFDLGGHSMLLLRAQHRLERSLGRELSLIDLLRHPTVGALARHLGDPEAGRTDVAAPPPAATVRAGGASPLVPLHRDGAGPPLLAVHPASGEVACYRELARRLKPRRPFYALRDPALEEGVDRSSSIEALARRYLDAARDGGATGPYAVVGYSFGGLVAFDMARQLVAAGEPVALLAILDAASPVIVRRHFADADHSALLAIIAREMLRDPAVGVEELSAEMRSDDPEEALDRALDRVLEGRNGDAELRRRTREFLRHHVEVFSARVEMGRRYDPEPFPGDLVFFRSRETLERTERERDAPDLGWSELCAGSFTLHDVPGAHAALLNPPQVDQVAAALDGGLTAWAGRNG